jgi:hypothetical protein
MLGLRNTNAGFTTLVVGYIEAIADRPDPTARPSPPPSGDLPATESPPMEAVIDGLPSKEQVVEQAPSVHEIVSAQPSVEELLGRNR